MDYKIRFHSAGTYYVWVRGIGRGGGSDSVYVGLDGNSAKALRYAGGFERRRWSWVGGKRVTVRKAGVHDVNVWMRESGFELDKILLTKSSKFKPSKNGPAESRRVQENREIVTAVTSPVITPNGGTFAGPVDITLRATIKGAAVYYTLDGTKPDKKALRYVGPFRLTSAAEVRARGYASGMSASDVSVARFMIDPQVSSPGSGTPSVGTGPFVAADNKSGAIVLEAEHAHLSEAGKFGHEWLPTSRNGATGKGAVQAFPSRGPGTVQPGSKSPRLDFQVRFDRTGYYYVWVRGMGLDSNSDSVHVGLDGLKVMAGSGVRHFKPSNTWTWVTETWGGRARLKVKTPGQHTVNVWMREAGFILDRIILVPSSSFNPTKLALNESPTDGGSTVAHEPNERPASGRPSESSKDKFHPKARADVADVMEDGKTTIDVLNNDRGLGDGGLRVVVSSRPRNGATRVTGDSMIVYEPADGYVGPDQFAYRVTDLDGDASVATVTVNVACSSCASDVDLKIRWQPSVGKVSGYTVYFGQNANDTQTKVARLSLNSKGFDFESPALRVNAGTDLNLRPGERACFRVKAFEGTSYSAFSRPVCKDI
jgi:hypothetical protein